MGRHRTSNAGVSIFQKEDKHLVEKKKRKSSEISIFDHVGRAQHDEMAQMPIANVATAQQPPQQPPQQQMATQAFAFAAAAHGQNNVSLAPPAQRQRQAPAPQASAPTMLPSSHPLSYSSVITAASTAAAPAPTAKSPEKRLGGVPMRRTRSKSQLADVDPAMLASSLSEAFGTYVPPHTLAAFLAFAAPGQENSAASRASAPVASAPVAPAIAAAAVASATGTAATPLSPGGRRRNVGGSRVLQMPSTALSGLRNAGMPHPDRPHPVPLRHSVSDIAEAFNLEPAPHSSAPAPFLLGDEAISLASSPERHSHHMSPSRMTRSRSTLSCSNFSSWPSDQGSSVHGGSSSVADSFEATQCSKAAQQHGGGGGGGFSGVPLQPTLSMVHEGLEALDAVGSPGSALGSPEMGGSPMRRTRSRGHPPALPLQRDMSNISVSDFFAGVF